MVESNSEVQLRHSRFWVGKKPETKIDRMTKNRIEGQSARGMAAIDAYTRYSVNNACAKFDLYSPISYPLIKCESAIE